MSSLDIAQAHKICYDAKHFFFPQDLAGPHLLQVFWKYSPLVSSFSVSLWTGCWLYCSWRNSTEYLIQAIFCWISTPDSPGLLPQTCREDSFLHPLPIRCSLGCHLGKHLATACCHSPYDLFFSSHTCIFLVNLILTLKLFFSICFYNSYLALTLGHVLICTFITYSK